MRTCAIKDGAPLDTYQIATKSFATYANTPDGGFVILFSPVKDMHELYGWDPQTKMRRFTIEDDAASFARMEYVPKAGIVLLSQNAGGIGIYSAKDGKKLENLTLPNSTPPFSISATDDGEALLAYKITNRIYFRPKSGVPFKTLAPLDFNGGTVPTVRLAPGAKHYFHHEPGKNVVHIYETATGNKTALLEGHTEAVRGTAFTPDGRRIISIGDTTLRVWDVETGKAIEQVETAGKPFQFAVSPDGRYVVTGPGQLQLWQLPGEGAAAAVVKAPRLDGPVNLKDVCKVDQKMANFALDLSSNGEQLFVGTSAAEVRAFKTNGGERVYTAPTGTPPWFVASLPEDNKIAFGKDRQVQFVDLAMKMGRSISFGGERGNLVKKMAVNAKDRTILMPNGSVGLSVCSTTDSKQIDTLRVPSLDQLIAVSHSLDGQIIIALTETGDLFVKPAATKLFKLLGNFPKALTAELSPDGKQVLVAYDPYLTMYDADNGKETLVFEGKPGFVRYASFLNGGRHVVSAHGNGYLRVWDAQTGKQLQQIVLPGASVHVVVSGDGRSVAAAMNNPDVIQVWRLESGTAIPVDPKVVKKEDPKEDKGGLIATSEDLSDQIVDCFYSSDGKKIYATAAGGAIHVLDPVTLKDIAKLNAIDARIMHAVAAPKSVRPKADRSKEWLYILDDQKRAVHKVRLGKSRCREETAV